MPAHMQIESQVVSVLNKEQEVKESDTTEV